MKLLLDTHVILWWQSDDRRLNKAARQAIATADVVWVSAVSAWEVSIKSSLGRLKLRAQGPRNGMPAHIKRMRPHRGDRHDTHQ